MLANSLNNKKSKNAMDNEYLDAFVAFGGNLDKTGKINVK